MKTNLLPQICKGCGNAPADPGCDGFCQKCYKALQSPEMAENFNYMSLTDTEKFRLEATSA